jgi:hypothetical protein
MVKWMDFVFNIRFEDKVALTLQYWPRCIVQTFKSSNANGFFAPNRLEFIHVYYKLTR